MDVFIGFLMILFPLLDVTDLILDGIFHDVVKSNSDGLLTPEDARDFKAPIFTFFILGCMAVLINVGVFITVYISQRGIAYKPNESILPLYVMPFITWFEDLPQIALCLIVAFKIDTWIDKDVQLAKAIFTIGRALVQLVYLSITRNRYERSWLHISIVLGNIFLLLSAIVLLTRLGHF